MVEYAPGLELPELLEEFEPDKILVITDANVRKHCYQVIRPHLPPHQIITVPAGEGSKSLEMAAGLWNAMGRAGLSRRSLVLALGGGMVTDLAGFVASTYMRGLPLVLLPTTLLAMADAALGGKTGIDFQGQKNRIGSFYQPAALFTYTTFLETLPDRELKSGLAEIIKHALIGLPHTFQPLLDNDWEDYEYLDLVTQSQMFKAEVVALDPHEEGPRRILNFGHTIGHAIEEHLLASHKDVLHGEAVAFGMVAEAWLSMKAELLAKDQYEQIASLVKKLYGRPAYKIKELDAIAQRCQGDKKNSHGQIKGVLLGSIGTPIYDQLFKLPEIKAALKAVMNL